MVFFFKFDEVDIFLMSEYWIQWIFNNSRYLLSTTNCNTFQLFRVVSNNEWVQIQIFHMLMFSNIEYGSNT